MNLSPVAKSILEKRYLLPGETPEQMCSRVAHAVAEAEHTKDMQEQCAAEFYRTLTDLDFLPNTPTLMNAGTPNGQLQACFVLPIGDSMHDIFTTLYNAAMIQKTGGGVGFGFSRLRPAGTPVSSTRGVSSGPISFLRVYDAASSEVEQGGSRRGANMACKSVYHPDIEQFIKCKDEEGTLTNFNISVLIDGEFLEAARQDKEITLEHGGKQYGTVSAQYILSLITYQAWKNGEPGVIFIDRINEARPAKHLGEIESTNPCGEQPLLPYESCNLGSINLANHLIYNKDGTVSINYEKIRLTARVATRFLDNVIDVTNYPLDIIRTTSLKTRKIGLGIMGWGTALTLLGVPYGSEEAIRISRAVMQQISNTSWETSQALGEEKGVFPECKPSDTQRRNATLTTIAPTGSLASIVNASYGAESIFGLQYQKKMVDVGHLMVVDEFVQSIPDTFTPDERDEILTQVALTGSCQDTKLDEHTKAVWRIASEISWKEHIDMQAAFQEFTDNAVSKTINMPNDATTEDIAEAIYYAYDKGCKGLTFYRAGSRMEEAVSVGTKGTVLHEYVQPRSRPVKVPGFTEKRDTGCGKLYVTINSDDVGPLESFLEPGAGGGCEAYSEGLSRTISLCLRAGVDPKTVVDQLCKVSCKNFIKRAVNGGLEGKSCPDAAGRVLSSAIGEVIEPVKQSTGLECPSCEASLDMAEGCWSCRNCGYTRC